MRAEKGRLWCFLGSGPCWQAPPSSHPAHPVLSPFSGAAVPPPASLLSRLSFFLQSCAVVFHPQTHYNLSSILPLFQHILSFPSNGHQLLLTPFPPRSGLPFAPPMTLLSGGLGQLTPVPWPTQCSDMDGALSESSRAADVPPWKLVCLCLYHSPSSGFPPAH